MSLQQTMFLLEIGTCCPNRHAELKMKIQFHLAVIGANVKRIVKLLFGMVIPPTEALGHA